jgi:hypothetical protein
MMLAFCDIGVKEARLKATATNQHADKMLRSEHIARRERPSSWLAENLKSGAMVARSFIAR